MFSNLSIRSKLLMTIGGSVLLAFLLAGTALVVYRTLTLEDRARQVMEPYAQLVAAGTETAVAFEDPTRAREILNTLAANPQVQEAAIMLEDGRELARFSTHALTGPSPFTHSVPGVYLNNNQVQMVQELPRGAKLYLAMDVTQLHEQTREVLWMFAAAALFVMLVALGQLLVLQRTLVQPISALTDATERVRLQADYAQRVPASGNDEVARLGQSFNAMIDAVREREQGMRELAIFQRTLLDSAAYGIISCKPDGVVTSFNPAAEKLLGYSAAEVVGKQTPMLWHDVAEVEQRAQVLTKELGVNIPADFSIFSACTTRNMPDEQEWTFIRKSGIRIPVFLSVTALRTEDGQVSGFVGIALDLTERKRTARELEVLNRAINASTEAVFLMNEAGRYVYANDTACKVLGYTRNELLSMTPMEIDPDLTVESFALMRRDAVSGEPNLTIMESRRIARDGRTFPVEISASVIEYEGEKFSLSVARDISERKKAEEEIGRLSLVVEQSPSCIIISDLQGDIIYVNQAFVSITGYSRDEAYGRNPRFLQSGKTPPQTYDDLWRHLKQGDTWRGEFINRRKDGSEYCESALVTPVRDKTGKIINYLAIKDDITERKYAAEREAYLAHFDQLTGLPNRTMLQSHFQYALSMAERGEENLAVMFLDLDRFKDINDTLGHSVGDQLLIEVAKRLKSAMREADTVSRMGGDEFIFVLPRTDETGAAHLAEKLIEAVSATCQIGQYELNITPSIGIAIYPEDGADMEVLSQNADAAMYQAKQAGRNSYRFFTQAMQIHTARNLRLGNDLRVAIARNQLQLHYQPQFSVHGDRIVGVEALLRWTHPELGAILPMEFIPIAEDTGQIIPIGEWVLRTAVQQMKAWLEQGFPRMLMAVNLSAVQFRHARLPDMVSSILAEAGMPPELLELELTEAVAMDDPLAAIAVMDHLHERGIRMSIDDFGTGYSSLSYLKRFRVSKLKIDQSFVRDISEDPEDKAIVSAIINMAASLGMHTLAEGVETATQLAFLKSHGCDEVQGYYFSKPLAAQELEQYLKQARER